MMTSGYNFSEELKGNIGMVLTVCLQELIEIRPSDPILYIAEWLYKYADNETYFHNKTSHFKRIGDKLSELRKLKTIKENEGMKREAELMHLQALLPPDRKFGSSLPVKIVGSVEQYLQKHRREKRKSFGRGIIQNQPLGRIGKELIKEDKLILHRRLHKGDSSVLSRFSSRSTSQSISSISTFSDSSDGADEGSRRSSGDRRKYKIDIEGGGRKRRESKIGELRDRDTSFQRGNNKGSRTKPSLRRKSSSQTKGGKREKRRHRSYKYYESPDESDENVDGRHRDFYRDERQRSFEGREQDAFSKERRHNRDEYAERDMSQKRLRYEDRDEYVYFEKGSKNDRKHRQNDRNYDDEGEGSEKRRTSADRGLPFDKDDERYREHRKRIYDDRYDVDDRFYKTYRSYQDDRGQYATREKEYKKKKNFGREDHIQVVDHEYSDKQEDAGRFSDLEEYGRLGVDSFFLYDKDFGKVEYKPSMRKVVKKKSSRFRRLQNRMQVSFATWYLRGSPPMLVCSHPVLGILQANFRRHAAMERSDILLRGDDFASQVLYDQEIYNVCNPRADDESYNLLQWTGQTWIVKNDVETT